MKIRKMPPLKSLSSGVIALVFLVVGFQAALFIHRSAVLKIIAGRDSPDTVIVYRNVPEDITDSVVSENANTEKSGPSGNVSAAKSGPSGNGTPAHSPSSGQGNQSPQRHNSSHSAQASEVRQKVSPQTVRPFAFNPNEASVEELVSLGFSYSQASSIDAYRKKGGRFRRKSDFERCRAVDEEMYRKLEAYVTIPLLDLNVADSAAFDALPGIGPYFASKFVSFRNELGGYACKEQLLDVWKMDRERYDKISDLVEVRHPYVYPLWRVCEDSLSRHPYVRSRSLAHSIVIFRTHNPSDSLSVDALFRAGVVDSLRAEKLRRLFPH